MGHQIRFVLARALTASAKLLRVAAGDQARRHVVYHTADFCLFGVFGAGPSLFQLVPTAPAPDRRFFAAELTNAH